MPTEDGRKKIIVREMNWLGDVLMSLPFLTALREKYLDAHIAILARPRTAAILQHHPAVNQIILCDDEGKQRGVGALDLAAGLRSMNFDTAYILPNSFSSAFMLWRAGVPERIGFATDGRSLLLTRAIRKTPALRSVHESRLYLKLLDKDPFQSDPVQPRLELTPQERETAQQTLASLGVHASKPLVGMVPGAAYGSAKCWHAPRFAALAERLMQECQAQVILFGASMEKETAAKIEAAVSPRVINLVGKTRLRDLAALLESCRLVITNDTGAMHVAAAVTTPVIALFGPTNPVTTAPVGKQHLLLRHPVDCSPCLLRHCPTDHRCMNSLEVDEVFEHSHHALQRSA